MAFVELPAPRTGPGPGASAGCYVWRVLGLEHVLHLRSLLPLLEEVKTISARRKLHHRKHQRRGSLRDVHVLVCPLPHECVYGPSVVHHGRATSQRVPDPQDAWNLCGVSGGVISIVAEKGVHIDEPSNLVPGHRKRHPHTENRDIESKLLQGETSEQWLMCARLAAEWT